MLLSDEEINLILDPWKSYEWTAIEAIREAVRLTAERCAQICEEQIGYEMEERAADACAAAIRERAKSEPV